MGKRKRFIALKFILHAIEQLDLAAIQLQQRTPAYSRFALILVDNAVDLLLHRWCEYIIHGDRVLGRLGPSQFTDKEQRAAVGQRFEEKPKFCNKAELLEEAQRDFILACHAYRNELYHVGLKHEDIIEPIASEYYLVACKLISEHKYRSVSINHDQKYSDAIKRHVPDANPSHGYDFSWFLKTASESLRKSKPTPTTALQSALWASAHDQIREISEALDFLATTPPVSKSHDDVLREVEVYAAWIEHFPPRTDAAVRTRDENFARYHEERQKFQDAHKQTLFASALR